jgi:hypothetical protein
VISWHAAVLTSTVTVVAFAIVIASPAVGTVPQLHMDGSLQFPERIDVQALGVGCPETVSTFAK